MTKGVQVAATRPLVTATADLAELDAITAPLDVAKRIGEFARRFGTLPTFLADRRAAALTAARRDALVVDIAEYVGLSPARISQITKPKRTKIVEVAA